MSRRPARFTEADLKRAWAVAQKYGPDVAVDILPDGTIRLKKSPEVVPTPEPMDSDEPPRVML
jgi:hypothetical protein